MCLFLVFFEFFAATEYLVVTVITVALQEGDVPRVAQSLLQVQPQTHRQHSSAKPSPPQHLAGLVPVFVKNCQSYSST